MANGLSAREEKLLRFATKRMSPAEVEAQTGWPAAQVLASTKALLKSFDSVYDDREQLQLMKLIQARHVSRLETEAEDGNKDAWKPLIDGIKLWQVQIENSMKRSDADLDRVTNAQATRLAGMAYGALMRLMGRLEARGLDVSIDEVEKEYHEILLEIGAEESDEV